MAALVFAEFLSGGAGVGIAVFFTGSLVVQFAGGVLSVAGVSDAIIRFGASDQPWFAFAFFKISIVIRAEVDGVFN